ncbi:substrate-specific activator of APC-dependent proteolysis [Thoreauomyces humboldtii]|nr:substrate-specific activator of APC-dependent proteolysis [Thoreauomyces humboldtii]
MDRQPHYTGILEAAGHLPAKAPATPSKRTAPSSPALSPPSAHVSAHVSGVSAYSPVRRNVNSQQNTPTPTPRKAKRARGDEEIFSGCDRLAMYSPHKDAARYAMRSPMVQTKNGKMNNLALNTAPDDYSELLHREITGSDPHARLLQSPRNVYRLPPPPHCSLHPKYLTSQLSAGSQNLLKRPAVAAWEIPKHPFKVLDAPDLQDDYYLNLIDWSSTDILAVGLGTCVYLWRAESGKVTKLCDLGPNDSVTSVGWGAKGKQLAIGTDAGKVQIWDIDGARCLHTYHTHIKRVGTISWNESQMSSGSRDKTIQHRDVRQPGNAVETWERHTAEVCGLKWDYEGLQLASGGNDNTLLVWDRRRAAQPVWAPISSHSAAVKAITWSPHKHNILASGGGTADRKIKIWNVQTHKLLSQTDTNSQVCNLAWGKQSKHLISTHGYSRNHITLWNTPDDPFSAQPSLTSNAPPPDLLTEAATLTGHGSRVVYLAVSPDGQNIVTGAGDETLRFWKICNLKKPKNRPVAIDTSTRII